MLHRNTYKQVSVDNKSRSNNGGYVTYFKLFRQLVAQIKSNKNLFTSYQYVMMNIIVGLKFLWWCGIKPLGQFVSKHTHTKGTYILSNGVFENKSVAKTVAYFLFGNILLFKISASLTNEDIKELLK